MEGNFESPISTLKVDFGCSKDCPEDVKNMLQQLKGVKAISIDSNQGTVTVIGNVNPMALIKFFHKMGKKAQLQSFDKAPMKSKDGNHHHKQTQASHCCSKNKKQKAHCSCESSSDSDSEDDSDDEHRQHKTRHGQRSKKSHGWNEGYGGFGNRNVAAAGTGYNYHPPMQGYHQPFTGYYPPRPGYHQPYAGYNYHHPAMPGYRSMAYAAAPSTYAGAAPRYGYYERGQPLPPSYRRPSLLSHYNPMIHYTSYADNYHPTV